MWVAPNVRVLTHLVVVVPAAGFLVRLFMIQHDCGSQRVLPPPPGERLGLVAFHHASSGHLERRGIGDINTMTVAEYLDMAMAAFWLPSVSQPDRAEANRDQIAMGQWSMAPAARPARG